MLFSVVIPCFQNQEQLSTTVSSLLSELQKTEVNFEVILVDDASTDDTWRIIQELASGNSLVRGIQLASNVGAYNAITHGFKECKGDAIIVMAADGDDPPTLVPKLIENFKNVDAVLATKNTGNQSFLGSISSRLFWNTLKLTGAKNIIGNGSDFLLVSRSILESASKQGWKSGNTLVHLIQHAKSISSFEYEKGKNQPSSWTFSRKLKLFLETINQFIQIPGTPSKPPKTGVSNRC